tara:strand:- start:10539 stop:11030 length:492 start_codon:yes stop_codon:yes gene_type:complete
MGVLTVTIKEEVTLNGVDQGATNTLSIAGVTQSFKRIVTLPADGGGSATQTTIANFRTDVTVADSALDDDDVKYVRVTNLESTNSVTLSLQLAANGGAAASTQATVLLEAGKSLMLGKAVGIAAVDDDAATATAIGSLVDLESIIAINDHDSAAAQLEVFIAS